MASLFREHGIRLYPANMNRVQGWAEILQRLGDPDNGQKPSLFIHPRCHRLLDCLPFLQHDPDHPADVLKTNARTAKKGLVVTMLLMPCAVFLATRIPRVVERRLTGFRRRNAHVT